MSTSAFELHDHSTCVDDAVSAVARHCSQHGLQFTPIRQRVLELLLEEHKALGAYDILEKLRAEGQPSQPPVAYRALEFLTRHGFAHRIERLNAFVACTHRGDAHAPAFLICRRCDRVVEADSDPRGGELGRAAKVAGFVIERTVREATGLCPACADAADEADAS